MTLTTTRLDYAAARKAMLDSQLRTSGVNDDFVLERMGTGTTCHPQQLPRGIRHQPLERLCRTANRLRRRMFFP